MAAITPMRLGGHRRWESANLDDVPGGEKAKNEP